MAGDRETYRRNAEEAEAKAAKATDLSLKREYLEIAEHWRRLAQPPGRWGAPPKYDGAT
jgi:hypothetical protein